jgi:predicted Kef-type K+ transport protein
VGSWIIAVIVLIVVAFVYGFVVGIINMIPLLGFIIALFLNVAFTIFYGRYLARVYEDTPAPA